MSESTVVQAPPKGTGREVTPLVAEDAKVFLRSFTVGTPQALYHTLLVTATELMRGVKGCSFQEARAHVAQGAIDRAALGEKKYGERLKAFNGRDAKVDLLQELLDALNYARQVIEELP